MPPVLTADDTPTLWRHFAKDEFFILKVHGDIQRPNTVVLTSRDYTKHVFGNLPFMSFLQRVFMGRSILFMGSSLTDVYLRRILEETTYTMGGAGMPHFAVLGGTGSIRAKLLRDRYNIHVITYDRAFHGDHGQALQMILATIQNELMESDEEPPQTQ
jgi:hypothetical protein